MMQTLRFALIFERKVDHPPSAVVLEHRDRLRRLAGEGTVALAGPFEGGGGLVVLDVDSPAEAERIVAGDPFVTHGTHSFRLVRWLQDIGATPDVREEA
jgi:uncharacterized protein YciI